ncbi:MAG: nitrous oxide reductase accessory protein NosL, partial [Thiovulaceae bacterium]|nr:nitrous oxide reductase accessory protein NosL [Sulfurimonadaceae bacterium]
QLLFGVQSFSKQADVKPVLTQKGQQKHWCPICGMNIEMYYKTSHASKLQNGTDRQYCSMHCLAVDMKEYGINTNYIKVVDAHTQKFIDANKAFYVIDSNVKGTMGIVSKFAFASKTDALNFKKKYAGKIVDFQRALKNTQATIKIDLSKQKKTKEKKVYPMGKKIYEVKCNKDIDLSKYLEINELKAAIKYDKLCKPVKEKYLHSLSQYLWDIKRFGDLEAIVGKIELQDGEKCPVCGMFTYKYPKWASQIFYKHDGHEHHHSFDGVKDMMKFYFDPMKWGDYASSSLENISKILVTDYYSQKAIDATKAYFVIGSDVYGPMGDELIPFNKLEDAKVFSMDHKGKKILQFNQIVEKKFIS